MHVGNKYTLLIPTDLKEKKNRSLGIVVMYHSSVKMHSLNYLCK